MQRDTDIRSRYEQLKRQLTTSTCFPYCNKILNLQAFVQENQTLYIRLLRQLKGLRKTHQSVHKRQVKIKTTPFYLQNMINSKTVHLDDETLNDLKQQNQTLKTRIAKIKQQRAKQQAAEQPVVKEKKRLLQEKKQQLVRQNETQKQLNRASQNEQLLQLYEQKCRECQSLRVVNNQLSEELKKVITEINKLTGNEENPNMFLLSIGIR